LVILRFPGIVGLNVDSPMSRFLQEPWSPVLMGFDPLMQIIHERDVVEALVHAVIHNHLGVFNIAAEGILPLRRLMGLAGKSRIPLFHPFVYWGSSLTGGKSRRWERWLPIEPDYIRYPWVVDLTKMREGFGFTPRYSAEETLLEFAAGQRLRRYVPEIVGLADQEQRLRETIKRRRRNRVSQEMSPDE
jgi:UDP-glucose 4-epimerase